MTKQADTQPLPSMVPGRADFQRAAALCLHAYGYDPQGVNSVLAEADQEGRLSALVLALVEMATAPEPLNSPAGIAGLRNVALGMSLDTDTPNGPAA
ncbi:hypothetical protein A5672_27195 [Mycobacterium alsense]|uniref:Uncharacterized protein n=1 Tax=Mycobacterium alsense TaxID=324058 RepID=A0ABD6NYU1_9MYCO|nr:hypothetical protein [Mycobacterium alsense]OBG30971.1 hypothetical protein A5672_27195 [Mycobacterium alsense]